LYVRHIKKEFFIKNKKEVFVTMRNFSKFLIELHDLSVRAKDFDKGEKYQFLFKDLVEGIGQLYDSNPIPAQEKGLWEHHSYKYGLYSHCLSIVEAYHNVLEDELNFYDENVKLEKFNEKLKVMLKSDYLSAILFYGAFLHDVAKIFGEKGYDHADKSYELILNNLDRIIPNYKTFFYNETLKKIADFIIRFRDHEGDKAQEIKEKYFSNIKTFEEGINKVAEYLNLGKLTDDEILFLYMTIPAAAMVKWHHMNFSHPKEFSQRGADLILFNEYLFPFILASIGADFLSIAFSFEEIE